MAPVNDKPDIVTWQNLALVLKVMVALWYYVRNLPRR